MALGRPANTVPTYASRSHHTTRRSHTQNDSLCAEERHPSSPRTKTRVGSSFCRSYQLTIR